MNLYSLTAYRNSFNQRLNGLESGQEPQGITRHGKLVAVVLPVPEDLQRRSVRLERNAEGTSWRLCDAAK